MTDDVMDLPTETKPTPTQTPKKEKSKARKIIEWILFGIFGVIFVTVLAGNISAMIHKEENFQQDLRFGLGSFVVQTDSMEPEYPVGTAIITYKDNAANIYRDYLAGKTVDLTFVNIDVNVNYTVQTERFKTENA